MIQGSPTVNPLELGLGPPPGCPRSRFSEDTGAELWLSPISVWELLVLIERGRVAVNGEPRAWVQGALQAGLSREAPLTHAVALESQRITLPHPDPADRFLAATARVLDVALATADTRLLAAKPCKLLANH